MFESKPKRHELNLNRHESKPKRHALKPNRHKSKPRRYVGQSQIHQTQYSQSRKDTSVLLENTVIIISRFYHWEINIASSHRFEISFIFKHNRLNITITILRLNFLHDCFSVWINFWERNDNSTRKAPREFAWRDKRTDPLILFVHSPL